MTFDYPGCAVHYELEGPADGAPILMLHGFGCELALMRGCMEPAVRAAGVQDRFLRVYLDLPGHGQSAGADLSLASTDAILDCALALQDHVAPGRPFAVVGESFGGYLALGAIARLGERVTGAQLLCPLTVDDLAARQTEPLALIRRDNAFLASLSAQDRQSFLQLAVRADEPTWRRFSTEEASGFARANPAFLTAVDERYPLSVDVDATLAARPFAGPALVVCGRQDAMVGYRDQLRLLPLMPRATFAVLDVAGHNLQLEQPELYTALAADWLRRLCAAIG
ncbi:alpha/beta hydrolase [bacterium]|nr:alpha/beta hydrolase [bacterium]